MDIGKRSAPPLPEKQSPKSNARHCAREWGPGAISGTSMATPHMAGILLLRLPVTNGTVTRTGTSEIYDVGSL